MAGDDSDIPKSLHNIVVSIHAIATFQALHDYLRPRVSGLLGSGSRLSGMFAALAASGYIGSSTKPAGDEAPTKPPKLTESMTTPSALASQRRRSQRLAKQAPTSASPDNNSLGAISNVVGNATSSVAEPAPGEIIPDSEFAAEFSDDENFDAEVIDDDMDHDNSISEKTVTLSVAEGLIFS